MISSVTLSKELEEGKVLPSYLLLGEDQGGKDEFLSLMERRFFGSDENITPGKSVYYGDEAIPEEIIEDIRTYSIFSHRKLVIIRDIDRIKNVRVFIDYVNTPNEESVLVMISNSNKVTQKLVDAVSKKGRVCIFWPMFQNESERWVNQKLKDLGIPANRESVKYIIAITGTRKNDLNNQIQNISNYLAEGERLTDERARAIAAHLYDYTVFDLSNALFIRNSTQLLAIFHYLIENGEDLVKLFYFCSREIQKIFTAYILQLNGEDFPSIANKLSFRKKEATRVRGIVQRMDIDTFRKLFAELHSLDYCIKTNPRELAILSFERFISEIVTR